MIFLADRNLRIGSRTNIDGVVPTAISAMVGIVLLVDLYGERILGKLKCVKS